MSAALTNYWQDFINQMVASGRYNNRSEVIRRDFVPWKSGRCRKMSANLTAFLPVAGSGSRTTKSLAGWLPVKGGIATRRVDDPGSL